MMSLVQYKKQVYSRDKINVCYMLIIREVHLYTINLTKLNKTKLIFKL